MVSLYYVITKAYGLLYNRRRYHRYLFLPLRFVAKRFANYLLPHVLVKNKRDTHRHLRLNRRIIVTLTSFPKRIDNVWMVIECMLRQTVMPDKIVLWLSKNQFNRLEVLPVSLTSRISEVFEIRLVDGDIRSHKKYSYAFGEFSDEYVITIDDDIFYPPYMIEENIKGREKNPDSVIGRYCLIMNYKEDGSLMSYNEWDEDYDVEQPNSFFGSGGGTLFVPSELYKDTTRSELAYNLAPLADDVWLNAMARLTGLRIVIISKELLLPIITKNDERLTQINVYDSKNDQQINAIIDYYKKCLGVDPFKKDN